MTAYSPKPKPRNPLHHPNHPCPDFAPPPSEFARYFFLLKLALLQITLFLQSIVAILTFQKYNADYQTRHVFEVRARILILVQVLITSSCPSAFPEHPTLSQVSHPGILVHQMPFKAIDLPGMRIYLSVPGKVPFKVTGSAVSIALHSSHFSWSFDV